MEEHSGAGAWIGGSLQAAYHQNRLAERVRSALVRSLDDDHIEFGFLVSGACVYQTGNSRHILAFALFGLIGVAV